MEKKQIKQAGSASSFESDEGKSGIQESVEAVR